jgi:very-short-patch-repair endonuclease
MIEDNFVETFTVDDYQFPKYIGSADVQHYRDEDLKSIEDGGLDSQFSRNFRNQLSDIIGHADDTRPFLYVQEFPVKIENKERWEKILKDFGLTDARYLNQTFFKLDYFFKHTGLVVEIDSNFHNKIYDAARDEYLKITYGLKTIRIFESPRDSDMKNFIKCSLEIFKNKKSKNSIFIMRERRVKEYIFDFLNKSIEMTYPNFHVQNEISIYKRDFYRNYYNIYPVPELFNSFIQTFEENFKKMYNKSVNWIK